MARSFDPVAYTMQVGRELVGAFQMAGFATTPGLVGSAREVSVREKLMKLLPKGVGIGSGCVIDSFGNCSRQMDVVLFENDFCPEFVINNDPASTYYPCEGVIAVGEVKTAIDSRELGNIFEKIKSVKVLRRFARSSPSGSPKMEDYVAFRKYGSPLSGATPKPGDYNQDLHSSDQVYGFALAGRLDLSRETLCGKFTELAIANGYPLSPNLVVSMDGTLLCPISIPPDHHNPTIVVSAQDANSIYAVNHSNRSFPFLLAKLQTMYTTGRTVDARAFDRYLVEGGILTLPLDGIVKALPLTG